MGEAGAGALSQSVAQLPMRYVGLALRSAIRTAPAAYWASWMDCFPMLKARHPNAAGRFLAALEQSSPSAYPSVQELQASPALLRAELLEQPPWVDVARGSAAAPQSREEAEP